MDHHIYNKDDQLIGVIKYCGATQFLYSPTGLLLGKYHGGYTYDAQGKLIGSGNLLALLYCEPS